MIDISSYLPEMQALKNELHENPEASLAEYKTTARIRSLLEERGIELLDTGLATGVVGLLRGGQSGKTVLLRADIDAILHPDNPEQYFHGCGHDFHTACLYGAACCLSGHREQLKGNVVLLFQPAEETTSGVRTLFEHGFDKLLERNGVKPDYVFGLHNRPEVPTGRIVVHEGELMAGKTNFRITINGKTGHGGSPHLCTDPIVAAAAFIDAVQTIVSRNTAPLDACVCSVCSIHSGTEDNFAPERAVLTGSIRALKNDVRRFAEERLCMLAENIGQAYGCRTEVELLPQVSSVINPAGMIELAREAAGMVVERENIVDSEPCLGGEDFSLLGERYPAFFFWLGSGGENGGQPAWHTRDFHTDDKALAFGGALLAACALRGTESLL